MGIKGFIEQKFLVLFFSWCKIMGWFLLTYMVTIEQITLVNKCKSTFQLSQGSIYPIDLKRTCLIQLVCHCSGLLVVIAININFFVDYQTCYRLSGIPVLQSSLLFIYRKPNSSNSTRNFAIEWFVISQKFGVIGRESKVVCISRIVNPIFFRDI